MKEINERHSVRKYIDKKVPQEVIDKILFSAMQSPSARNQKPWHFLVVQNKEKLSMCAQELPNCHMVANASFVIIFMTDKENLLTPMMYPQDMSASVTLSLIEAKANNVGSCWCGIFPNEERMAKVKKVFNIEKYEPFAIVAYGYPDETEEIKNKVRIDKSRIHIEVL